MRNLWLLLQRHAFFLAFIALLGLSLSVLVRHDGSARSSWFALTGGASASLEAQRRQWSDYLQLAERNAVLSEENAALRSRLLSLKMSGVWKADSSLGWRSRAGVLIKAPDGLPSTMALARLGAADSIHIGDGVLASGGAFGTVVDVGERYSRILPLLNTAGTWSCRIGRNGAVAPLRWDGRDPERFQLYDVPRYATAHPGDTVYTSGFDLRFPDGIPVGTVQTTSQAGSDFQQVQVAPLLDFTSARHLEFLAPLGSVERDVLAQPLRTP